MRAANRCGRTRQRGLTLIEVAISMLLASVVITAMLSVRYYTVQHAKRADVYNNAGRLALLMIEGWRGAPEPGMYTPIASFGKEFTKFEPSKSGGPSGPSPASEWHVLDPYHIVMNNLHYYATLSYQDATADQPAAFNVCVGWKKNYVAGTFTSDDEYVQLTTYN